MARSRRKNPVTGNTKARSEKKDKKFANRKDRRLNKEILEATQDDSETLPKKTTSNRWDMDKDGKNRFDPEQWPEGMRK